MDPILERKIEETEVELRAMITNKMNALKDQIISSMPEQMKESDFSCQCNECGDDLDFNVNIDEGYAEVIVEPCESCVNNVVSEKASEAVNNLDLDSLRDRLRDLITSGL